MIDKDLWRDIGHDVSIQIRSIDGEPMGVAYRHPRPDGSVCEVGEESWVPFSAHPRTHEWALIAIDPLTISPSLLCTVCGHHGFIREGRWVPA